MDAMSKGQASQQQATSGVDESECEWSEPKSELKRSGEKALIAGFQAERVTITATQSCKSKKNGQVCDFGLALDQWLAPGFEASSEAQKYQRAYAEKLGLGTASSRDFAERAQSMFGRYKGIWSELGDPDGRARPQGLRGEVELRLSAWAGRNARTRRRCSSRAARNLRPASAEHWAARSAACSRRNRSNSRRPQQRRPRRWRAG